VVPVTSRTCEKRANDGDERRHLNADDPHELAGHLVVEPIDASIDRLEPTIDDVESAVHGIEPAEIRRAQTKEDVGVVRVDFRKSGDGYELVFEDDGAGISPDTLKSAAIRKQIITEEEAAGMDTRAAMALIFRPGFSTQEEVSMDAGRGVGMDVVARSVYALGGKIGVSTNPGKFTRFKIVLPAAEAAAGSTAVA